MTPRMTAESWRNEKHKYWRDEAVDVPTMRSFTVRECFLGEDVL